MIVNGQKSMDFKLGKQPASTCPSKLLYRRPVICASGSSEDKDQLVRAGLDWNLVEDLKSKFLALQQAQSLWSREHKAYTDSVKIWRNEYPSAYELRDYLMHYFYHAFRAMPDVIAQLHVIGNGSTSSNMIQDLSDLAAIGRKFPEELSRCGFEPELLDQTEQKATVLNEMLAQVNNAKAKASPFKEVRDKAYFFVKEAVDEIRHHGQFVFWHDDDRKQGYTSGYLKKQYFKRKMKTQEQTSNETPETV